MHLSYVKLASTISPSVKGCMKKWKTVEILYGAKVVFCVLLAAIATQDFMSS